MQLLEVYEPDGSDLVRYSAIVGDVKRVAHALNAHRIVADEGAGPSGPEASGRQAENTTVRRSSFADTNGTALEVENTDTTVDARYNWWGCPDGPDDSDCDAVIGDAVYDPWLTGPVGSAGDG